MSNSKQNNLMNGWVRIFRTIAITSLWLSEPFTRGQAWLDLLLLANYSEGFIRVKGCKIPLKSGQVGWSQLKLAERWKWSRSKVKRFLNELEEDGAIKQHTNHVSSTITITNYCYYQNIEQQKNNSATTGDQATCTNNKNKKNKKNEKREKKLFPPSLEELTLFFLEKNSTNAEAEKFMDYYSSNGWKVGKNTMKDWKATARNWIRRAVNFNQAAPASKNSNFIDHETDF